MIGVPFLDRKLFDRRDVLDAGVVDQDIDAAELLLRERDHLGNLGGLRDIGVAVDNADIVLPRQVRAELLDRRASPKPLSTMLAPAAASSVAMPSPMPLVDPVTSAVLPASPMMPPASDLHICRARP